jgi:carbon monoxide dehydrogenase subunit G
VLVSDFAQIDRPFEAVREELVASGSAWLGDSLVAAYEEGERLSLKVSSAIGPLRVSKRVWAELGEMDLKPDRITQPLRWRAAGTTGLFPAMVADLEITPMGATMTSINFMGRYVPPLGPLGREVDRVLLHRLAQASVRALLERVAGHLGSGAGAPHEAGRTPVVAG